MGLGGAGLASPGDEGHLKRWLLLGREKLRDVGLEVEEGLSIPGMGDTLCALAPGTLRGIGAPPAP